MDHLIKILDGGGSGGGGLGKQGHNVYPAESLKENPDCKICKYLKESKENAPHMYFKNHLGLSPGSVGRISLI